MTETEPAAGPPKPAYPKANRRRNAVSHWLIWLLPLAVIGVCGYLVDKNVVQAGPEIDIAFAGSVQVEADKTPMRYKGVEIGRVKSVSLSPDLQKVIVHVQLEPFAKAFAREGAEFWIVRPEITSSGIVGIETLTQGSYLSATPGKGEEQDAFQGLSDDPEHTMDRNALTVVLSTDHVEKLRVGSAVNFRGVPIGEISAIELDKSAQFVRIALFIRGPYRSLVNASTHFEYAGNIQASFNIKSGFKLQLPSFQTLLSGSINVVTPNRAAPPLDPSILQKLYPMPSPGDTDKQPVANAFKLTLTARKVVKLAQGSQVLYRGLPVGQVDSVVLNKRGDDVQIHISIAPDYVSLINASSKFWYSNGIQTNFSLFGGASVQFAGLPVLLNGAVDFTTPDKDAPDLPKNAVGPLFDKYDKAWDIPQ